MVFDANLNPEVPRPVPDTRRPVPTHFRCQKASRFMASTPPRACFDKPFSIFDTMVSSCICLCCICSSYDAIQCCRSRRCHSLLKARCHWPRICLHHQFRMSHSACTSTTLPIRIGRTHEAHGDLMPGWRDIKPRLQKATRVITSTTYPTLSIFASPPIDM